MRNPDNSDLRYRNPTYAFIAITLLLFVVEVIIIFLLRYVIPFSAFQGLISAFILTITLCPILYFLLFLPLITQGSKRRRIERQLNITNQLANIFLTSSDEDMYADVLQLILEVVESPAGVFGYIDQDGILVCPSMTRDVWDKCNIPDKKIVFPPESWGGVWGQALKEKKSLCSNEPSRAPAGHIPILRNLAAPIIYQGNTIGLLHVANRATDYTEKDHVLLETLAENIAPVLASRLEKQKEEHARKHAEEELQQIYNELEKKVEERTVELSEANKLLKDEIEEREKTERVLQRRHNTQNVLNALLNISMKEYGLVEMLDYLLDRIVSVPWLSLESGGAIFLVEDTPDELVLVAHRRFSEDLKKLCAKIAFGRCLCGRAALNQEIEFADCVNDRHDNRFPGMPPHGHYCVPIISSGNTLGVLALYVKEGHRYKEEEELFLLSIANGLAGIIERKQMEEEIRQSLAQLRKTMGGIIQAMTLTIEARDPYTAGHQRRVSNLARTIADEMLLSREQIDGIRVAGIVHDLGKISVPIAILKKSGRLTGEEFDLIKSHADVAFDILKTIDFPWPVADIVFQHHERMDGSGYPLGLSGDEILLEARIVAVADVVEAMASDRPYRPALGIDEALNEVIKNKGVLYDAQVVDVCVKLFKEKGFKLD